MGAVLIEYPTRDPYSKSSLCILHTRPSLQVLDPSPQHKSSLQVLTVYPSPETLTPSPQHKSSLCIIHTRPLLQVLTVYHSPESLTPRPLLWNPTMEPYCVALLSVYIGIEKWVIY